MNYNPDTYNTPNAQVSPLSIKSQLTFDVQTCMHMMLWWGNGSHLNVGYRSDDPATISLQLAALKQRGIDFVFLNWYGTMSQPTHNATLAWIKACEANNYPFAICMARGMFEIYNMPKNQDITAWGVQMMAYAHANFLSSPMYKKTSDGRSLMVNFDWTGVSGLDEATILAPYSDVAMLYEHSTGVSKPHSSGAFGWIGVDNSNQQGALEVYAKNFLAAMSKSTAANPKLITMGSLVWGFDDHNRKPGGDPTKSAWDATKDARFADGKQGQTWLNLIKTYNDSLFKPQFLCLNTWNDYEEDTALERGIDSQLTAAIAISNGILTATLTGNLNTVDHVEFYVNGQIASSTQAAASLTFDLSSLNPANNQTFALEVIAVGKPQFQNKLSNTISTTAALVPAQTVQVPISTSIQVPLPPTVPVTLSTSVDVPISVTFQGLTITGSLSIPVNQTVDVPVSQTAVTVPVSATATAAVTSQTVWS